MIPDPTATRPDPIPTSAAAGTLGLTSWWTWQNLSPREQWERFTQAEQACQRLAAALIDSTKPKTPATP